MKISKKQLKQIILEELRNEGIVEKGRPDLPTAAKLIMEELIMEGDEKTALKYAMDVLDVTTRSGGRKEFVYDKLIEIFYSLGAKAAGDGMMQMKSEMDPQYWSK